VSAVLQADVQTFAPGPDLFGAAPAANDTRPPAECLLTLTGVLTQHAQVRTKQLDDHHYVPVVCLEIEHVGAGHHRVHAEQPFTEETRPEAEALAKRLRRGDPVTVTTSLADIRVFLPSASINHH
jgi:hypothetical protein